MKKSAKRIFAGAMAAAMMLSLTAMRRRQFNGNNGSGNNGSGNNGSSWN